MELISTDWRRLWLCSKFLCSIFSKDKEPFNFIKRDIIKKLATKVKLWTIWKEPMQKKGTESPYISVQSVEITFILFTCHRSTDNSNDFYSFSCREKAHNNRKFSHENSKHRRELRIATRYVEPCRVRGRCFCWYNYILGCSGLLVYVIISYVN